LTADAVVLILSSCWLPCQPVWWIFRRDGGARAAGARGMWPVNPRCEYGLPACFVVADVACALPNFFRPFFPSICAPKTWHHLHNPILASLPYPRLPVSVHRAPLTELPLTATSFKLQVWWRRPLPQPCVDNHHHLRHLAVCWRACGVPASPSRPRTRLPRPGIGCLSLHSSVSISR
jgi:hypothetical protein